VRVIVVSFVDGEEVQGSPYKPRPPIAAPN
jgi:hypothetical protein